jgi:hypothetical protein
MILLNILLLILFLIYIFNFFKLEIPGVQYLQGDHHSFNGNNSVLFLKLDKLRKDELVETVKDLQSKVREAQLVANVKDLQSKVKDNEMESMTITELIKSFFKRLYYIYISITKILMKIAIVSLIFKFVSKIRFIKSF